MDSGVWCTPHWRLAMGVVGTRICLTHDSAGRGLMILDCVQEVFWCLVAAVGFGAKML